MHVGYPLLRPARCICKGPRLKRDENRTKKKIIRTACRISTSLKITLLYFRPDLITYITSCTTLTFIYRTFSIYHELSLTFLTNKREQETHFLYFCFQDPYCIANAHTDSLEVSECGMVKSTNIGSYRANTLQAFITLPGRGDWWPLEMPWLTDSVGGVSTFLQNRV
jgi:hypothetical protein